jgi:hypothetical protein
VLDLFDALDPFDELDLFDELDPSFNPVRVTQ